MDNNELVAEAIRKASDTKALEIGKEATEKTGGMFKAL